MSSRVEEGHLTFPSAFPYRKRFASWKHLPRRAPSAKRRLRSSASACLLLLEELSKKAENDVVFFRYSHRRVSHLWRRIATIRICRVCKQVLELPKACWFVLFDYPIAFRVEKGHFYCYLCILTFTVNTAFLRLQFLSLTHKIPTVNVKFPRLIPTFPHRNPIVFELIVTVKSHFIASAVCANFPKSVSNLSIIAGNRHGRIKLTF